jgi:vacuolar-type H+-ATPase subunit E/Vma4
MLGKRCLLSWMRRSLYRMDRESCSLLFPRGFANVGSSAGGVVILGGRGKIEITNTFEERLRLLEIDGLPAVRETLFGKNLNRRFTD